LGCDGSAVPTAVNVLGCGEHAYSSTWATCRKARRLRRDEHVQVALRPLGERPPGQRSPRSPGCSAATRKVPSERHVPGSSRSCRADSLPSPTESTTTPPSTTSWRQVRSRPLPSTGARVGVALTVPSRGRDHREPERRRKSQVR
jgi:hypothetical protein